MSTTTSNYNLVKPTDIETADITVINSNMDIIDNTMKSQSNKISALNSDRIYYGGTSTGSGNAYAITIDPSVTSYSEPLAISFKANYSSTGASTINVNNLGAKAIKKANGSNVTNLIAGSIYTMRYNGTNFILQGEGGSGNATASDILAGKTASTDAGDVVGNIPSKLAQTYNPSTTAQTIASGQYLSGNQTIAPVTGNTTINDVVSGKVFSSANGINLVGSATIESLGGRRYANGSVLFPDYGRSITITLGFMPKIVYLGRRGTFYASFISNTIMHSTSEDSQNSLERAGTITISSTGFTVAANADDGNQIENYEAWG